MHIILANRWYPPASHGGVAMYNQTLARALVQLGHRVTVVAARTSPAAPETEDDQGVTVHRLLTHHRARLHRLPLLGRYMRAIEQFRYSRRVARKLNQLARVDRPDVIEFAEVNAEAFAYLRQAGRCPVVVRCHTPTFVLRNYHRPEEMPYDTRLVSAMEKFCIRHADALTAPSNDMARTIAAACDGISADQIHAIPNALDVTQFAPPAGRNGKSPNGDATQTVLHVGRLDRVKGIEVLAQAIPHVVSQAPQVRFVFVGAGDDWQQRLTGMLRADNVAQNVEFTGGIDHETLIDWYHRADIAVVPSLNYESFSYTVAQAMAAGLPVVASRIGGIPETAQDGLSGFLTEPGDHLALAGALSTLLVNPKKSKTMGTAGYQRAKERFEALTVAEQTLRVYEQVMIS
jgi:glycosyltransferase involved in cell wall biosynthesis